MTTHTLQDMPEDILEIIYLNLTLYESVQTNIAICKRITKCQLKDINKKDVDLTIQPGYYKYINMKYPMTQDRLDNLQDGDQLYGVGVGSDVTNIDKFKNVKKLNIFRNFNDLSIDEFSDLIELSCSFSNLKRPFNLRHVSKITKLICRNSNIYNIDDFINLTYLDCWGTPIGNVNSLINLTHLDCSQTSITDVNALVNLKYLCCFHTNIANIDGLINLERLVCSYSRIRDINNLTKLKSVNIFDSHVRDISKLTNLIDLTFDDIIIRKNNDMWEILKFKNSTIILPRHIESVVDAYKRSGRGRLMN